MLSLHQETFDLNDALEGITSIAEDQGFKIPDETIIKVFAMSVGKEPTPPAMLDMRNIASEQLLNKLTETKQYLGKALEFLKDQCNIYSYDFVPYEGQLLVLVKRFMEEKPLTENDLALDEKVVLVRAVLMKGTEVSPTAT